MVKLEIHKIDFFSKKINDHLLFESAIITDTTIKYCQKNYEPFVLHCITTELSRINICDHHWIEKYSKSLNSLKEKF